MDVFARVRGRNGLYKVVNSAVTMSGKDMTLLIPVNEDRTLKRYDTALLVSNERIVDVSPQHQISFGGIV